MLLALFSCFTYFILTKRINHLIYEGPLFALLINSPLVISFSCLSRFMVYSFFPTGKKNSRSARNAHGCLKGRMESNQTDPEQDTAEYFKDTDKD